MKSTLTREEAGRFAEKIGTTLQRLTPKFELGGSYRRGEKSIGDLDFVAVDVDLHSLRMALAVKMGPLKVLRAGTRLLTIVVPVGGKRIQVDFMNVEMRSFGSAMLHSTGPVSFNIALRISAKERGMLLSQHGLFKGTKFVMGRTEEGVFRALGMSYIAPEKRDMNYDTLREMHGPSAFAWRVQGEHGMYTVRLSEDGKWTCNCKGFFFHRVQCTHIDAVKDSRLVV